MAKPLEPRKLIYFDSKREALEYVYTQRWELRMIVTKDDVKHYTIEAECQDVVFDQEYILNLSTSTCQMVMEKFIETHNKSL